MNNKKIGLRRYSAGILAVLFVIITIIAAAPGVSASENTVNFNNGVSAKSIITTAETVGEFLEEQKVSLKENENVSPSKETEITNNMDITINKPKRFVINGSDSSMVVTTSKAITKEFIKNIGFNIDDDDYITKTYDSEKDETIVTITNVEYQIITQQLEVESSKIILYNDEMYQDESSVKKSGEDGITEVTNKIRYENGKEVSKVKLSEKVIKIATDTVIEMGTKSRNPKQRQVQSAVIDETSGTIYTNSGEELHYSKIINVTATAYSPDSCGKSRSHPAYGITASGIRATYGVIAVDPRIIPLGTKVYITAPDGSWTYGTAVAADTGGAIKGHIVDLCYETNAECFAFGRRYAKVYILE